MTSNVHELDRSLSKVMGKFNAGTDPTQLSYAQELLNQLDALLDDSLPSEYVVEKANARGYRQQLSELNGYNKVKAEGATNRRDQLLAQANRIQESSNRLNDIQRMALENEKIGGDVLTTLRGQRETLERSRGEMADAEENVNRSNKTLKSMASWW
ncbi:hypothetical protein INT44_003269 [Umbelopsis vinacea]|uniref:t-SNARE coiled-coil homology domain-containing protein n=1 Tax=Umbelopsis vinacea TaxID=44442 RepID=A0A8H7UIE9_9FUNG|nr:hypothetical protein INT44_003269 [Umbelopsis vinacea]